MEQDKRNKLESARIAVGVIDTVLIMLGEMSLTQRQREVMARLFTKMVDIAFLHRLVAAFRLGDAEIREAEVRYLVEVE